MKWVPNMEALKLYLYHSQTVATPLLNTNDSLCLASTHDYNQVYFSSGHNWYLEQLH